VNKNDPNDTWSVALAALRSPSRREVRPDDHAAVLKMWSKRHPGPGPDPEPGRLPAARGVVRADPGWGYPRRSLQVTLLISWNPSPRQEVEAARCELAAAFPGDLRRVDAQLLDAKKKLTVAVRASGTTLTQTFGVGPVVAATVIGCVRGVSRFPGRDHFAAYNGTAPIEVSSGNRKIYRLSRRRNRRPAT